MKVFISAYFITSGHSVQKWKGTDMESMRDTKRIMEREIKKEAHHYLLNKWRLIQIIIKRLLLWRS